MSPLPFLRAFTLENLYVLSHLFKMCSFEYISLLSAGFFFVVVVVFLSFMTQECLSQELGRHLLKSKHFENHLFEIQASKEVVPYHKSTIPQEIKFFKKK